MKPIGTIAILIAMLVCMWSAQAQHMTQSQETGLSSKYAELNPDQLKLIKHGMSLEEVSEIIDAAPTEIVQLQGKVRKGQESTLVWYKGDEGKYLHLVLRSNAVVMILTND